MIDLLRYHESAREYSILSTPNTCHAMLNWLKVRDAEVLQRQEEKRKSNNATETETRMRGSTVIIWFLYRNTVTIDSRTYTALSLFLSLSDAQHIIYFSSRFRWHTRMCLPWKLMFLEEQGSCQNRSRRRLTADAWYAQHSMPPLPLLLCSVYILSSLLWSTVYSLQSTVYSLHFSLTAAFQLICVLW